MNYEIKLPLFEGPFDLLLFFIERDELDIYDIPISKITSDFLNYMKQLEATNMEIASEFIVVAATLMNIKGKMLLPRQQIDDDGKEIDPREELVKHLLEYKKFKSVIEDFTYLETERLSKEKRGNVLIELKQISETSNLETELQDIDLFKLLKVYEKVMNKFEIEKKKPIHTVVQYPYTIEDQKRYLMSKLLHLARVSFEEIIQDQPEKIAVVYNFLSILELLQLNLITIHVGLGYNNFWIEKFDSNVVSLEETMN